MLMTEGASRLRVFFLLAMTSSALTNVDIRDPPRIVEPLTRMTYYYREKSSVTINCTATGTPMPTYEWHFNGVLIERQNIFFDANTGLLTIPALSLREEGLFKCRATNRFPNGATATAISSDVEIRVARVEDFETIHPTSVMTAEGKYIKLACNNLPKYYGTVKVKWYNNFLDKLTEVTENERRFIDKEGTLHFSYILKSDEFLPTKGSYTCGIDSKSTGEIKLGRSYVVFVFPETVSGVEPVLVYNTTGKSTTVHRLETAVMECVFGGYINESEKSPQVTWLDDEGIEIATGGRYTLESNGRRLIIHSAMEADEKVYTCLGRNSLGVAEGRIFLNVTSPPIWVRPLETVTCVERESAKFYCSARSALGETPPDPPEWHMNGLRMGSSYDPNKYIFSSDSQQMSVLDVDRDSDIACFQCYVRNSEGLEFAGGCLKVILPIVIVYKPPRLVQELQKGDKVNLTVVATSDPSVTLMYKWVFRNKTYDDASPPPHVTLDRSTKVAYINTSHLTDSELEEITGVYRREIYHQYQTQHVDIEVREFKRIRDAHIESKALGTTSAFGKRVSTYCSAAQSIIATFLATATFAILSYAIV